jgi:hypothetical protein
MSGSGKGQTTEGAGRGCRMSVIKRGCEWVRTEPETLIPEIYIQSDGLGSSMSTPTRGRWCRRRVHYRRSTHRSSVTVSMGEERKGVLRTMLRVTLGGQRCIGQHARSDISLSSLLSPLFRLSACVAERTRLGGLRGSAVSAREYRSMTKKRSGSRADSESSRVGMDRVYCTRFLRRQF